MTVEQLARQIVTGAPVVLLVGGYAPYHGGVGCKPTTSSAPLLLGPAL